MKVCTRYFGDEDDERLTHTDINDAIYEILESQPSPLPEEIDVVEFEREAVKDVTDTKVENILEIYLEHLDEEYGGEDTYTESTPEMHTTIKNALNKINKLYVPWQCNAVKTHTVNCKKWVMVNAKEWVNKGVTFEEDELKQLEGEK